MTAPADRGRADRDSADQPAKAPPAPRRAALRLKPRARDDLLAIRAWGEAHWGPARTRDFLEGMIEALEALTDNPHMGRARDAFLPGLRSLRHRGYVAFYLLEEGPGGAPCPAIVAVLHERRNHAALDFAERMEGEQAP